MKSRKYLRRAPKIFALNWLPEIRGREVTNNTHIGGKLSRFGLQKVRCSHPGCWKTIGRGQSKWIHCNGVLTCWMTMWEISSNPSGKGLWNRGRIRNGIIVGKSKLPRRHDQEIWTRKSRLSKPSSEKFTIWTRYPGACCVDQIVKIQRCGCWRENLRRNIVVDQKVKVRNQRGNVFTGQTRSCSGSTSYWKSAGCTFISILRS